MLFTASADPVESTILLQASDPFGFSTQRRRITSETLKPVKCLYLTTKGSAILCNLYLHTKRRCSRFCYNGVSEYNARGEGSAYDERDCGRLVRSHTLVHPPPSLLLRSCHPRGHISPSDRSRWTRGKQRGGKCRTNLLCPCDSSAKNTRSTSPFTVPAHAKTCKEPRSLRIDLLRLVCSGRSVEDSIRRFYSRLSRPDTRANHLHSPHRSSVFADTGSNKSGDALN